MKTRPVFWLRKHPRLKRVKLVPLIQRRVPLRTALAIEASRTASAWLDRPHVVRGGPWCLGRLHRALTHELHQIAEAARTARSIKEEAAAVFKVATSVSTTGALVRHLKSQCYRCGLHLVKCCCKGRRVEDLGLDVVKRRSGKTGHQYRSSKSWRASDKAYKRNKWGKNPAAAKRRDNRKYPNRKCKSHM